MFLKLTNLTTFASLLKDVSTGCKDTVLPEPLLKTIMLIVLLMRKIRYNPTMTIFACLEH